MTLANHEAEDADLARRAAAGDRDAFEQLFDRHVGHIAAICRQRLGACDVDDAVQETFTRALANLHRLRDTARFGAWVRSIAVRACVDHHRYSARSIATPVEELDLTDARPQPDELVVAYEHSASVRRSLAQLGPRDAHALWLRHVTGAPVTAVADELGLTPGSTRVLLTRARHRLRAVTTLLPALVPLSWRQWFRAHLPASAPALDAMAAAVAFGLVAGVVSAPADSAAVPAPAPAPVEVAQDDIGASKSERSARPAAPPSARQHDRAHRPAESRRGRAEQPRARHDRQDHQPPSKDVTVADAVTVTNEYPREDEAERLASVQVANAGEKQGEFRFYGTAPKPVKQTRRSLPGPAHEGVEIGGVYVGPGEDTKRSKRR